MPSVRICQWALAAALVFATATPLFAQSAQTEEEECACKNKGQVNLLPNGAFETVNKDTAMPEHWSTKHPQTVRVIDLSADFRRAVQVQASPKAMAGDGIELISDPVMVRMQRTYRIRGYVRSEAPRQDVIVRGYVNRTRVVDGRTERYEHPVFEVRKPWKPVNDWRHFSFTFDSLPVNLDGRPQPMDHVRVILVSHAYGGTCWYDDVTMEAVSAPGEQADDPHAGHNH